MNKIEQLLTKLCPNGIEMVKIGDVCDTITDYTAAGSFADIAKNVHYINGESGFAQLVRTTDLKNSFANDDKLVFVDEHAFEYLWRVNLDKEALVLPNVGNCGEVYYVTPDILPQENNVLGPNAILVRSNSVSLRYLYHVFQSHAFQVKLAKIVSPTGQTKFNKTNFKELTIPVPPEEVQNEIIRMLDVITEKATSLIDSLEKEVDLRQRLYEFYRDELLSGDNIEYKLFGDIAKIQRGASPRPIKNFITDDENGVNWIKIGDVKPGTKYVTETAEKITKEGSLKSRYVKEGDFILSNSMSFGRPYIVKTEGCIHDGWLSISEFDSVLIPDFLYHLLNSHKYQSIMRQKASFGGAVQNLNADIVRSLEMPIIDIEEQEKIVRILDELNRVTSGLVERLKKEIELRKKELDYYKDKLLLFAEE